MGRVTPEDAVFAQARKDLDRWASGDTAGYAQAAADDVTYFHNGPALPRIDGKKAFRDYLATLQGEIPVHTYELLDPKVQLYGSVGILTMCYRALSPDGAVVAVARGTTVYRASDGAWEMVHAHWSDLAV